MTERAADFHDALWKDLRRNRIDADLADVKFVADEAAYARRRVRRWMRPLRESTPLILAPGRTRCASIRSGSGRSSAPGIIRSHAWSCRRWSRALAAGNAAVPKPSEGAPPAPRPLPGWFLDIRSGPRSGRDRRRARDDCAAGAGVGPYLLHCGPPSARSSMAAAAKVVCAVVLRAGRQGIRRS